MLKYSILILFLNTFLVAQSGIYKTKYPNGNTESELSFVDEIYEGTSFWYYENGNLKEEKTFSGGKLHGWVKSYFETGLLKEEFYVEKGVRDGLHKTYYENGGLKSVLSYDDGVLKKKIELDFDRLYVAPPEMYLAGNRQYEIQSKNGDLICDADFCPIPIDGLKSMQDNIIYPEHAKLYGLEGSVLLIADINEKGIVTQTTIVEGIGLGCNEEAQRVVMATKFIPGQTDGKIVNSHLTIRIDFKLDDKGILTENMKSGIKKNVSKRKAIKSEVQKRKNVNSSSKIASRSTSTSKNINTKMGLTCTIDVCPEPKGGIKTIVSRVLIPSTAKRMKISGKVIIDVEVDQYGFVRDTKVIKGLGYGIDEAVEVAMFETEFIPGSDKGKKVRTSVRLEIDIKKLNVRF